MGKKVLLLSSYDARSHRHWRKSLVAMFPSWQWTQLTLPARHFNWRIRGNSLSWGFMQRQTLEQDYDLIIATSMVDLSSLRGFVPALTRAPTLVYFHENQFAYPQSENQRDRVRAKNVEPQLVPIYTALCAQKIIFNSAYNRLSFLEGASSLFKKLPDFVPPDIMDRLTNSQVIAVPLDNKAFQPRTHAQPKASPDAILDVIWNHRWEYDKGPEILLAMVEEIRRGGLAIRVHLLGEQFRHSPPQFQQVQALLDQHYQTLDISPGQCGFIETQAEYFQLLHDSDVALSTALHDFQGLSLMEATACGCTPLAPKRLVYPEYLDDEFLYSGEGDAQQQGKRIATKLDHWLSIKRSGKALPTMSMQAYSQSQLNKAYAEAMDL